MKFQDYYKTLGVERTATAEEIRKSFKKLARKYHPDVSKEADAENKFKELNEAYEVLGDKEKRERYDALGANWKDGQEFRPPPGFEEMFRTQFGAGAGPGQGSTFHFTSGGGGSGFSDFFSSLFGDQDVFFSHGFGNGGGQHGPFAGAGGGPFQSARSARPLKGGNLEAEITITVEEAFYGGKKKIAFELIDSGPDGSQTRTPKNYTVTVPPGTKEGSIIRLTGEGQSGYSGGASGDLLLKVRIAPHPRFSVDGFNISSEVEITPWEAALGAKVPVATVDGKVQLTIPAGTQSGQKFRIPKKGLPKKGGERGDFFVASKIVVPSALTENERELLEKLRDSSSFNPRVK
ncbi:MAG: DnaJ domain-containing protein [Bdellovibrionales bacterium]|nr:DnaJ domain-containing protein [Bdellovibrionales bacterium]